MSMNLEFINNKYTKIYYQITADKNPMKDPSVVLKLSGSNHWSKNPKNRQVCEHCQTDIDKSNYKMYHGDNCKVKING